MTYDEKLNIVDSYLDRATKAHMLIEVMQSTLDSFASEELIDTLLDNLRDACYDWDC